MKRVLSFVRRHHVTLLALFVVLGGTAYAAAKIGSGDIKAGAVRSKHVKNDALTGVDVNEAKLNVSRVVLRLRGTSHMTAPQAPGHVDYPVHPTSYTQGANETDNFIVGQIKVLFPAGCTG